MVTRSPNNFASTEYAPGPRKMSAAAVNILKIKTKLSGWPDKKRFATAVAHATTARTGVKKPRQSENEIMAMRETTAQ